MRTHRRHSQLERRHCSGRIAALGTTLLPEEAELKREQASYGRSKDRKCSLRKDLWETWYLENAFYAMNAPKHGRAIDLMPRRELRRRRWRVISQRT